VEPSDIQGMHAHLSLLLEAYDIPLPRVPDLDFSRVEEEWKRLTGNIPDFWLFSRDTSFLVGDDMKAKGLTAQHPVVLIPGVVSTVCVWHWCVWVFLIEGDGTRACNRGRRLLIIARSFAKSFGAGYPCYLKSRSIGINGWLR
jgi:hypothetical protein